MPYRIDVISPPPDALDLLIKLGALDVDGNDRGLAAILPDAVAPEAASAEMRGARVTMSAAIARDHGSVWLLHPRTVRVGSVVIASPGIDASPGTLRLSDSNAFGSGHHATTVLCLEFLHELLLSESVPEVLDVGTGTGILALAALEMGVRQAVGIDLDPEALAVAAENARMNHLSARLQLMHGGPEDLRGVWPLVVANILAAPLIEMAPGLVQRVASHGHLLLSGIPSSVRSEVRKAYEHLGMKHVCSRERDGWILLVVRASW